MEVWARTEVGLVRELNEDAFLIGPNRRLLAVADGMGGHQAGEVASKLAVVTLDRFSQLIEDAVEPGPILEQAFLEANSEIWRQGKLNPDFHGMGTTLTAVAVIGSRAVGVHVGDSRLYLWRRGVLRQLSTDHSVVEELVRSGAITSQTALNHPFRNILTRALGTEQNVQVDLIDEKTAAGDRLLLCSDGLTNMVLDEEIETILNNPSKTLEELVNELVALALRRGGYDNITVVLAQLD